MLLSELLLLLLLLVLLLLELLLLSILLLLLRTLALEIRETLLLLPLREVALLVSINLLKCGVGGCGIIVIPRGSLRPIGIHSSKRVVKLSCASIGMW